VSVRTAFITGVTGQTGSYLAELLVGEGARVVGLVRDGDSASTELLARTPQVEVVEGDLADFSRLPGILRSIAPDVVYNLGGLTSVGQSWNEPMAAATITGLSAAALLDGALAVQTSEGKQVSFVQASSAEIFGSPVDVPQTEFTAIHPLNPYGAAKAYAHFLVGSYRTLGLAASGCILYNHESPRRPDAFVTRKITRAVARISLGLQDTLVLGALDVRRDWGWAPDYAAALALIGEAPATGTPADDYIVASGTAHSVEEFVAAAFRAAGIDQWRPLVTQDPAFMRPADAAELVGDATRIRTTLGWAPTIGFDELVAAMVRADLEAESGRSGATQEGTDV
jgi:GDPmannose 4,6-dehydratase